MIRYEIYTVSGIDNFSFMDIRFKKRELVHLMRFIQIGVISLIVASPLFLIVYRFEKQISENPLYLIFISPIGLLIASFFLSRIGTMLPTAALEKNTTLRTSYKKSDKIWVSGLVTIFTISIIFSLIGFLFLFFYQYVENLFILHFLRILENTVDFISFASIAIALGYFYKAIEES